MAVIFLAEFTNTAVQKAIPLELKEKKCICVLIMLEQRKQKLSLNKCVMRTSPLTIFHFGRHVVRRNQNQNLG